MTWNAKKVRTAIYGGIILSIHFCKYTSFVFVHRDKTFLHKKLYIRVVKCHKEMEKDPLGVADREQDVDVNNLTV